MKLPRMRYHSLNDTADILSKLSGEIVSTDKIIHWACHQEIQTSVIVDNMIEVFGKAVDKGDGSIVFESVSERLLFNSPIPVHADYVRDTVRDGYASFRLIELHIEHSGEQCLEVDFPKSYSRKLNEPIRITKDDLVVTMEELDRFTSDNLGPADVELDGRERDTLLAIIRVLALEDKTDLSQPYKAAEALAKTAALHGLPFPSSKETIAKKLKAAGSSVYAKRSQ